MAHYRTSDLYHWFFLAEFGLILLNYSKRTAVLLT